LLQVTEYGLGDIPGQVDPLRSTVPLIESGEFSRHYLTARPPHRDGVGECLDVVHAGDPDLPHGALA
jgi:hypothetical protein